MIILKGGSERSGIKNRILRAAAVVMCLCLLLSCRQAGDTKAEIRIHVNEQITKDGTVIQIPVFTSDDETIRKNLRDLEKETKALQKTAEKEQKKGTHMEMRSYLNEEKNYPQVTVVWYLSEEDSRTYDLVTLGADEREGMPITCKEALEKTGMSGVDLSLNVGRLAQGSGLRGELLTTEMQGFRIDENGETAEIYMKLRLRIVSVGEDAASEEEETETIEEHFFSYSPKEDRLVRLSERGFDIP